MAVVEGGAAFVFKLHVCFRSGAKPVVDMVAIRGLLRTGRQTCLCSFLSIWAIVLEVDGAHVRVCVCCVTSPSAAIGVSKLAVHFFVVLAVCHRGVGEPLVLFADVVWSGLSGVVSYLELPVAVRNQAGSR